MFTGIKLSRKWTQRKTTRRRTKNLVLSPRRPKRTRKRVATTSRETKVAAAPIQTSK